MGLTPSTRVQSPSGPGTVQRQTDQDDRKIENYYEKIRSGKQEKPFHEIILQASNKHDMSADSENGQLAAAPPDEYMKGFG